MKKYSTSKGYIDLTPEEISQREAEALANEKKMLLEKRQELLESVHPIKLSFEYVEYEGCKGKADTQTATFLNEQIEELATVESIPWYFNITGETIMVTDPQVLIDLKIQGRKRLNQTFMAGAQIWEEIIELPDEELDSYDVKARFEVLLGE